MLGDVFVHVPSNTHCEKLYVVPPDETVDGALIGQLPLYSIVVDFEKGVMPLPAHVDTLTPLIGDELTFIVYVEVVGGGTGQVVTPDAVL